MDRSVLFQAHHLPLIILDKLFVMSKGFLFLIFELLLVGMALFSDQAGTTYIDRRTRGDMFQNSPRNTSRDCVVKGAICTIGGGVAGDKICEKNCCFCRCENDKPTFLIQERRCVERQQLLGILQKQGNKQGCLYRSVVAASSQAMPTCRQKVLVAIDTTRGAKNYSMKFCAWSSSDRNHPLVAKGIKTCSIVPSNSSYLFNGTWFPMWAPEAASRQDVFNVYVEGNNTSVADILLEWNKNLPSDYAGLIVSLKIRCQKNDGRIINSCLFSKNRGTFNGSKPTLYPPTTRIISSATAATRPKMATAISATTTEPKTNGTNGTVLVERKGEKERLDVLLLVLATLGAILLLVLLCVSLLLLIQRRRRREIAGKFQPRGNPVYQKGPSISLKLKEGDVKQSLPFIINDESRDQQNGVPAWSKAQGPLQSPSKDPLAQGPSSAEPDMYQCLIEEDVGGKDYQELLDDKQLEELREDEHEYHVLESDGASSDSDSYSVEMPPVENTKHISLHDSNLLDDLLDDIHDYDEPDAFYESKEPGNRIVCAMNDIRGDKRIGDEGNARLSGYDEAETILRDGECDSKATLRCDEKIWDSQHPVRSP